MKRKICVLIACVCIMFLNAQSNISVIIGKVVVNNAVYITTTITNNNVDEIILNNRGMLNDYGQIDHMSSCYSIFVAYPSLSSLTGTNSDIALFIDDSSFPQTKSPIILKQGESYKYKNLLYDSNHWKGLFPISLNGNIAQISEKVHLRYFLLKDLTNGYDTDFISNKLTL